MVHVFEEKRIQRALLKLGLPAMLGSLATLMRMAHDSDCRSHRICSSAFALASGERE